MKTIVTLVLTICTSVLAQTEDLNSIEVVEIFSAQTPAELEASLTDGYPMPWLEDILNDESIPEEDRYWLDCRIRAVIAQDLHLFFDEDGNPVHIEADWIMPGDNYWRETYVISPLGDQIVSHPVESGGNLRGEIGQLVDRFGQDIGETALTARGFRGSRNGSIWASVGRVENQYHLILLYSDGSYYVSPIEMSYGRCAVSQSGEHVILAAHGKDDPWGDDDIPPRAILLNKSGEVVWERELEMTPIGNPTPVISPDDRYCAVVTQASSNEYGLNHLLQVLDVETGQEILRIEDPPAAELVFSNDGKILNVSGLEAISIDVTTGRIIWTDHLIDRENYPIAYLMHLDCSNSYDLFSGMVWPSERLGAESVLLTLFNQSGNVLVSDNIYGNMDISPNGYLVLSENYQPNSNRSVVPVIIRRIIRDGE